MKQAVRFVCWSVAMGTVSCADGASSVAKMESASQGWSIDGCRRSDSDHTAFSEFAAVHLSPATYNTCYKGYVVDLWEATAGSRTYISAEFPTAATTQAACQARFLGVIKYTAGLGYGWAGSPSWGEWDTAVTFKRFGTWNASTSKCRDPYFSDPHPTSDYVTRYVVTARYADSSSSSVVPVAFYKNSYYAL